MEPSTQTKILCVDDERGILDGLSLHLRRRYDVLTAQSGSEGLEIIGRDSSIAVVISDMRMPGMNGATFLSRVRQLSPKVVRVLLTGQADLPSAIAAINEGQIFRFLTKPCPPATVLATIEAAVDHNRLITAERVLLEQTLHGSIKALTDILALTNPVSFGRATRIKQLVGELAAKLALPETWQLEVAAMLSQLGYIALPPETVENLYYGRALSVAEQAMAARAPAITEQLVRNIPRLEMVAEILANVTTPRKRGDPASVDARQQQVDLASQLLRVALDFDSLEAQGSSISIALGILATRQDGEHADYEPRVLDALAEVRLAQGSKADIREVPLALLCVGMVFVDDVKTHSGTLMVARGFEITSGFLERARNFRPGTVKEPFRVVVRHAPG